MAETTKLISLQGDERKLYMCLHGENSDDLSYIAKRLRINYDLAEHMIRRLKKLGILIEKHEKGSSHYYFRYEDEIPEGKAPK